MIEAVIVDVIRTASGRGKPGGALHGTHPVDLLATVLESLVGRTGIDAGLVDDVIAGCVNQVGDQSLNIARHGLLAAGLPEHVPGTTIDRQCGSSQQAVMFAAQAIMSGTHDIVIAAGVESMSRVPMGSSALGRDPLGERLRARYPEGLVHQGISAEIIASKWGFSRADLDEYSARSHRLAADAADGGLFDREIIPVRVRNADGESVDHVIDETVRPTTTAEALSSLQPAFAEEKYAHRFPQIDWKITAGNSSPYTDGASAALICSAAKAAELGLTPRARFTGFAVVGADPIEMLTAPIPATRKVLQRTGLAIDDIDAYEVNEAFAPVPLAWAADLGADLAKLNPRGGAIALGHPLGASGTRLLATLVNHLEHTGGRYGLQTMCEGAGMANATIIERI
ncbi:acetyl-CoA acyltransferase [Microbacterium terrae]|uniref:Acyltransferase n=1 Tax=Microbacterium terrae TaxID=69369 RepID=A0A0M2H0G3_9MICO|nr:thiolase family protein [Microbacterium terrae]KJL37505.1 putative acyltransferase [Microbacterium terrae]MBP1076334.1 acetyl-CoA acyltransferase [Microbacterium terrae]GLJ97158.1 acetyl-CoA acyltransferase [Microbacterium terrae]